MFSQSSHIETTVILNMKMNMIRAIYKAEKNMDTILLVESTSD